LCGGIRTDYDDQVSPRKPLPANGRFSHMNGTDVLLKRAHEPPDPIRRPDDLQSKLMSESRRTVLIPNTPPKSERASARRVKRFFL
jgi:hypothetical protein